MLPVALKEPQGGKLPALVALRSACATLCRDRRDVGTGGTPVLRLDRRDVGTSGDRGDRRDVGTSGDRRDACPTPGGDAGANFKFLGGAA